MSRAKKLPARRDVKQSDTWDLSSLFPSDAEWTKAFARWEKKIEQYGTYRGKLAESPQTLAHCLRFDSRFDRDGEKLGTYAFLKSSQDLADSRYQELVGQYQNAATRAAEAASFIRPEILAVPRAKMEKFLEAKPLRPFRLKLQRLLRYKPHTLGKKEERLLAMQNEMAQATNQIFEGLHDADMRFGTVRNEEGQQVELTNASFTALLHSPKRSVRRQAFLQYYQQYKAHENTLAATLAGSIHRNVYYAKVRDYDSALSGSLFHDNIPLTVYDNLIDSVHRHLPALHRYYDVRRRKMRLRDIHHYDTYVPILSDLATRHTWNEAVRVVLRSLEPLGEEYCRALEKGLMARWCDRYPSRGKRSGAFSCGSFDGDPYILMNYRHDVLDDVFTLAHEAGHSMHSYYSARNQPFDYYDYTIFVAEVASTLNEQLLSQHLMAKTKTPKERAYLVNREIDAIRGTLFRQTMFAEFEKQTHQLAESGHPLTVQRFQSVYGALLETYFGPRFTLDDELKLECFRIPHFYRAFYVYKYATGISAAIALAERITRGGPREVAHYLRFLKSGSSKDPLDLLRDAGVDMQQPQPVEAALERFDGLVDQLDELI